MLRPDPLILRLLILRPPYFTYFSLPLIFLLISSDIFIFLSPYFLFFLFSLIFLFENHKNIDMAN